MPKSKLEDELYAQILGAGLPKPVREYRFYLLRKWRFDFAWPSEQIAVEVEGGIFVKGAHTRGASYRADCEKYNNAVLLGWRVLRFTDREIKYGKALGMIEEILSGKEDPK